MAIPESKRGDALKTAGAFLHERSLAWPPPPRGVEGQKLPKISSLLEQPERGRERGTHHKATECKFLHNCLQKLVGWCLVVVDRWLVGGWWLVVVGGWLVGS